MRELKKPPVSPQINLDHDMFFFVTSGAHDLRPREACLVESASLLHPGKKVFVLFITANVTDVLESPTLSYLIGYTNIHLRYIKVSK